MNKPVTVLTDECPRCGELAILSDDRDSGFEFTEPLCEECREKLIRWGQMDSFDIEYERARANGWED